MRPKKDKSYYIERAEAGVRTLIIYFNVTRPVNSKAYQSNGEFNIETYKKQMKFLSNWGKLDQSSKKRLASVYAKMTTTYNYTQGIPVELLKKVCGYYVNDDGKQVRMPVKEVLERLVAKDLIRAIEDQPKRGSKFKKLDNGEYVKKCWWYGKYLLKNQAYQFKLMMDKRYWKVETFPVSKSNPIAYSGYATAKNAIFKWIEDNKKKHTEGKDMTVEELKDSFAEEASHSEPTPEVDVHIEEKQDDIYADIPPEQPRREVKVEAIKVEEKPVAEVQKVEIPEEPKPIMKLTSSQKRRLDNYIERVKAGVLSKETFRKYLKEEFGNVIEATQEYIMANIQRR